MLVDLVAIVPLFLNFADGNSSFVRLLRLSRIFRLQRLMSEEWRDLMGDMTETQIRLANVALSIFSIIYMSAGFFYFAEVNVNPQGEFVNEHEYYLKVATNNPTILYSHYLL